MKGEIDMVRVLNLKSGSMGLKAIVLIFLVACLFSSCGSIKNVRLTTACKEALASNPNIDASKLTCNVKDGIAYVSGWVYTEKEKDLVEEILRGVEGVIDVRNTIKIEEGGETNPVMLMF
jgi:hypothetical protein